MVLAVLRGGGLGGGGVAGLDDQIRQMNGRLRCFLAMSMPKTKRESRGSDQPTEMSVGWKMRSMVASRRWCLLARSSLGVINLIFRNSAQVVGGGVVVVLLSLGRRYEGGRGFDRKKKPICTTGLLMQI